MNADPTDLTPADLAAFPPKHLRVWAIMRERLLDRETDMSVAEIADFCGVNERTTRWVIRDLVAVGLVSSVVDRSQINAGRGERRRRTFNPASHCHVRIFKRLRAGEVRRCKFCDVIAVEKKSGRPMGDICRTCAGRYGGILWWPEFRKEARSLVKGRRPPHLTWSELLHLCHKHEAPRLSTVIEGASRLEQQRGHPGAIELCARDNLAPALWRGRDNAGVDEGDYGFLWDTDEEVTA